MSDFLCGASAAKRGNGSAGQFSSWKIRDQINILASQVDGALTNFPIFLNETILNNLPYDIWSIALNGGGDLRFASDAQGNNRLACEVVTFNTSTQKAEIHVKAPSVSSAIDTPIYIFYGKVGATQPAVTDTYGRNNVWDSNFIFVNHMNSATDSTGKTSFSSFSGTVVDGKVGSGVDFNGTSDKIDYNALAGPNGNFATFEFWSNFDALARGDFQAIMNTDGDPNSFHLEQQAFGNNIGFFADPPPVLAVSSWNYTLNTWQHTSALVDTTTPQVTFRLNYSTISTPAFAALTLPLTAQLNVGGWWNGAAFARWVDGTLDELRISNNLRPLAWRKASYVNQNLTTDFLQAQSFITP